MCFTYPVLYARDLRARHKGRDGGEGKKKGGERDLAHVTEEGERSERSMA